MRIKVLNGTADGLCRTLETKYSGRGGQHHLPDAKIKNTSIMVVYEKKKQSDDPHSPVCGARMD